MFHTLSSLTCQGAYLFNEQILCEINLFPGQYQCWKYLLNYNFNNSVLGGLSTIGLWSCLILDISRYHIIDTNSYQPVWIMGEYSAILRGPWSGQLLGWLGQLFDF